MMDGNTIGFIGVALLVLTNIAAVAYSYGKLSQKVNDLCRRVTRLENACNARCNDRRENVSID